MEIIVEKGEIALIEQFLLFPQLFIESSATYQKIVLLFGKRDNPEYVVCCR